MNFLQSWRRDAIINIKLLFFLFFFRACVRFVRWWTLEMFIIFRQFSTNFIFFLFFIAKFIFLVSQSSVCQSTKYEFRSREKKKNYRIIESCQRNFFTKEWENSTRVSFCREINLMHSPPTNVSFANDLRNFSS